MLRLPTLLKAFLASFTIYLLPLIGPHAFWTLGLHLIMRITRAENLQPHRLAAWIAVEWAIAIVLQLLTLPLWYRFFARPRWQRVLPLIIAAPLLFAYIEWQYLIVLPSRFLIEPSLAPETGQLPAVCTIPNMYLAPVRTAPNLPLERASQVWLSGTGINDYAILTPDCQLQRIRWQLRSPSQTQPYVVPGGQSLFATWDKQTSQNLWHYHDGTTNTAQPLARPPSNPNKSTPILSTDGRWFAWIEYNPGVTVTPLPEQLVIRSLHGTEEHLVKLPPPGRSSFVLLSLNMDTKEILLFDYQYSTRQSSLLTLGLDGATNGTPTLITGVDPQAATIRIFPSSPISNLQSPIPSYVAWDAYRESDRYKITWSLPVSHSTYAVPLGSSITDVAVHPAGTYIAVSTTTALNIGHTPDSVFVFRPDTGQEIWRRYLPTYTRSGVSFLGDKYFAYSDIIGTQSQVHILQLPP